MSKLIKPIGYKPLLDMRQTEQGIKLIKEFFQMNLSTELRLRRVTAPLFVLKGLGINDDLNGVERPVTFPIRDLGDAEAEVVHSLAKWKRLTLADYKIEPGYGVYADMNAIRADEELDNLHSLYVDQWDWEAVMTAGQRNLGFLKDVVRRIYSAIRRTEFLVCERYPEIRPFLPEEIRFIESEELLQMYPGKSVKEREDLIAKEYGAVFIIGIGGKLSNGEPHDGRAPRPIFRDNDLPLINPGLPFGDLESLHGPLSGDLNPLPLTEPPGTIQRQHGGFDALHCLRARCQRSVRRGQAHRTNSSEQQGGSEAHNTHGDSPLFEGTNPKHEGPPQRIGVGRRSI